MKAKLLIKGHIGRPEMDFFSLFEDEPMEAFTLVDLAVFLSANQNATELEITIESGGGFVDEGFAIYDMLRETGKPITTIAKQADSIASVIFLAGDVRKVYNNAQPVIHFPFIENLFVERATADELAVITKGISQMQNRIINLYEERTGANADALKVIMEKNEPITAATFMQLGFASELINETASVTAYQTLAKIKAFNNFNKDTMKTKSDLLKWFEKIELSIKNLGKQEPVMVKNLSVTLKDSSTIYVKTEAEAIAVNDPVFTDPEMTQPALDGDYVMSDDSKITLLGGVITAITPVEAPSAEAQIADLTERLNALTADLAAARAAEATAVAATATAEARVVELTTANTDLQAKVTAFNTAKAANDAKIVNVTKELEDLKKMVLDSNPDPTPDPTPKSRAEEDLELRRKIRNSQKA